MARRLMRLRTVDRALYETETDPAARARLAAAAGAARAEDGGRVALIVGATPRSGTNFIERLLAAHPAVLAAPLGLRELPLLGAAARLRPFERALAAGHAANADLFAPDEWLCHAAAGYVSRLAREAGPGRVAVIKEPRARRLDLLDAVFPRETAILVARDGRRAIDSALRTWPPRPFGRTFADLCLEWALATGALLDAAARLGPGRARLVRFETAARAPAATARALAGFLGLDPAAVDDARAARPPVVGSSTHSRTAAGVDWTPRAPAPAFDPAGRPVRWSRRRDRIFARICAAAQARLDAAAPVSAPAAAPASAPIGELA